MSKSPENIFNTSTLGSVRWADLSTTEETLGLRQTNSISDSQVLFDNYLKNYQPYQGPGMNIQPPSKLAAQPQEEKKNESAAQVEIEEMKFSGIPSLDLYNQFYKRYVPGKVPPSFFDEQKYTQLDTIKKAAELAAVLEQTKLEKKKLEEIEKMKLEAAKSKLEEQEKIQTQIRNAQTTMAYEGPTEADPGISVRKLYSVPDVCHWNRLTDMGKLLRKVPTHVVVENHLALPETDMYGVLGYPGKEKDYDNRIAKVLNRGVFEKAFFCGRFSKIWLTYTMNREHGICYPTITLPNMHIRDIAAWMKARRAAQDAYLLTENPPPVNGWMWAKKLIPEEIGRRVMA